jgi:hypothetical protein
VSKRETGAERRARLEEIQKAQKAEQRKRTLLTAGVGLGAGVLIIGGSVAWIAQQQSSKPSNRSFGSFGVPAAEAGCGDVTTKPASGTSDHTNDRVDYDTAPPSFGRHANEWVGYPVGATRNFFTVDDAPGVENVVHNLEHGYNVLWYSPDLPQDQVDVLRDLTEKVVDEPKTYKFITTAWDTSRGEFPDGKKIAMSHWGAENGSVQYCEQVSGEAVGDFVDAHPITDAPEPNAY